MRYFLNLYLNVNFSCCFNRYLINITWKHIKTLNERTTNSEGFF